MITEDGVALFHPHTAANSILLYHHPTSHCRYHHHHYHHHPWKLSKIAKLAQEKLQYNNFQDPQILRSIPVDGLMMRRISVLHQNYNRIATLRFNDLMIWLRLSLFWFNSISFTIATLRLSCASTSWSTAAAAEAIWANRELGSKDGIGQCDYIWRSRDWNTKWKILPRRWFVFDRNKRTLVYYADKSEVSNTS